MTVLEFLARLDKPIRAEDLARVLGITVEAAYLELVALEGEGKVQLVAEKHVRKRRTRIGWEAMKKEPR